MPTMNVEYTDTFSGEVNYSWVKRIECEYPENAKDPQIKQIAKKEMSLSGVRGKWSNFGDMLQFVPNNSCTILFVTFN